MLLLLCVLRIERLRSLKQEWHKSFFMTFFCWKQNMRYNLWLLFFPSWVYARFVLTHFFSIKNVMTKCKLIAKQVKKSFIFNKQSNEFQFYLILQNVNGLLLCSSLCLKFRRKKCIFRLNFHLSLRCKPNSSNLNCPHTALFVSLTPL